MHGTVHMTDVAKHRVGQSWPDEVIDQVRAQAEAGLSAREIASELGVTRNVVIGLCSRRGITLKGATKGPPARKGTAQKRERSVKARSSLPDVKPVPVMMVPPTPPSATPISILELNDARCRWPLGDFADRPPFQYCGAKTSFAGSSWCPYHRHLAGFNKETSHAPRSFKAEAA